MKRVRDQQGNELKQVLLQVLERDEQGPILLRVRRDHERIDLNDPKHRTFLLVWVGSDQVLGEMQLNDLIAGFDAVKEAHEEGLAARAQLDRDIENIRREVAALELDNKTKTEALRQIQKERDPERLDAMVKAAVAEKTGVLEAELANARTLVVDRDRYIAELRESKRRLKEANERLKDAAGR